MKLTEQSRELRKIWSSFQQARVLMTANNYRVFDSLEKDKTAAGLAARLKTDKRATEILLDALTGMGLLQKIKGCYRNRPIASRLLVSHSPTYQGDIIKHADVMWDKWSDLDHIVKTGSPSTKSRDHGSFIMGMHNLSVLKAGEVIDAAGMKGVERALDLGGGPGTYSIELARRGISTTHFDTPDTVNIAKKVINKEPAVKRNIQFITGNFLTDDIGQDYDLILISQILHMFSPKVNIALLRKCRKALRKKGRVVIQEFLINRDLTQPLWGALFSVNMLVHTEGGRTYSPDEIRNWLLKSGFKTAQKKIVAEGALMSARK